MHLWRPCSQGFCRRLRCLLLPVYLAQIGLGALKIGLVATLTLLGSASMTLLIGLIGARLWHIKPPEEP